MRKSLKITTSLVTAGILAASLAACTSAADDEATPSTSPSSSSSSSPSTSATTAPVAALTDLSGVDTKVALDAGFVEALGTLGLTPGVTGGATLTDGVLAFPITGGNVDYYGPDSDVRPYVQGEIDHDGSGITLTAGDTVVGLSDFVIDPGSNSKLTGTVTVNGEEVGTDINIFRLDGTTLNPLTSDADGNAVLQGTTVYISEDAAALLNDTFGTDAVTGDLEVGIATITATGTPIE